MSKVSSKVLLVDAFSTLHVGNGALIDNTYKLCREYLGDEIEILSIDTDTNKGRFPFVFTDIFTGYGGSFINKLRHAMAITLFTVFECLNVMVCNGRVRMPWGGRYRLMVEALERADICVSLSGETINDYYRPHMYLRLLTYYLAILKGKKFILFPQSIGPIFRSSSKWLLRKTLSNSHAIMARDYESFALATEIWGGGKVNILFSPDVATTQESSPKPLPLMDENKKVIGLTVSNIPKNEMRYKGDYLRKLLAGISISLDKDAYQFLLMPSNYRHNELSEDYRVCLKAKHILCQEGFDVVILNNKIIHPDVYQGMQKNLFAFISTRMHVGILATSGGVPTLMINTQHKIRSYMSLIEMDDFVVELDSLSDVTEKLKSLLNNNVELRAILLDQNKKLREQVLDAMLRLAKSL